MIDPRLPNDARGCDECGQHPEIYMNRTRIRHKLWCNKRILGRLMEAMS